MKGDRPHFIAYVAVQATNGGKTRWREIGAAWWNRGAAGLSETAKDRGLTVWLDAVPVSGKLVLMPPKEPQGSAPSDTTASSPT